jgi:Rieske Fe-S protein
VSRAHAVPRRAVIATAVAAAAGCTAKDAEPKVIGTEPAESPAPTPTGTPIAKAADARTGTPIPVTGPNGVALIVMRRSDGSVVGFDAACTHLHCTVKPDGDKLICPCHLSVFDGATGRAERGPAVAPLRPVPVAIVGEDIIVVDG